MSSIVILVPTKSRPAQCKRMMDSAVATADNIYIAVALSEEDRDSYQWKNPRFIGNMILPDGMPTVHKWNLLAEKVMNEGPKDIRIFMLGADDTVFATPMWDRALIDHYNALDNKIHVYALQDSRDKDGTPHIFVTREWIEAMGWAFPPIFLHWYLDSWTVEVAKSCGVFTHMKDYLLIHDKPSDKGEGDSTHTGIRAMGWRERDKWVAEHCRDWLYWQKVKLKNILENGIDATYKMEMFRNNA